MELRDYWNIVLRHWKLIAVSMAVGVALASVLTVRATPTYSSSARVLFTATKATNPQQEYKGGLVVSQQINSYANLINGSRLANDVSTSLGGSPPPGELQGIVTATVAPSTAIVTVSVTTSSAPEAQRITEAYAEGLSKLVVALQTGDSASSVVKAAVVDRASLPGAPTSPNATINVLAGLLAGLMIGLGLTVLRELLDNSVTDESDLARITDTPVMATIPRDPASAAAQRDPPTGDGPWAEAFRVLRTRIRYAGLPDNHTVIVVTAGRMGDGASTTAAGLAAALASTEQRVALVECDLRHPVLARRLGLDPAVGLSTVLSGNASVDDALQEARAGLHVLPCGPLPPQPAELLQSGAMAEVLTQLRKTYDVVILDAPPVLPVADAAGLAAQADGTLLVVRQRGTDHDDLAKTTEQLSAVGARLLGVVVNLATLDRETRDYGNRSAGSATD